MNFFQHQKKNFFFEFLELKMIQFTDQILLMVYFDKNSKFCAKV